MNSAALALATWGLDGLSPLAYHYGRVLAQPARQKFALLVGINQYSSDRTGCQPLDGCRTDVELQHQLLAYRFGFRWENIYTLLDDQATRWGIEDAFFSHLLPQVQPDDLVVIHFSGYGSTIALANQSPHPSFVLVDSVFPWEPQSPIQDLPQDTLRLLVQGLSTQRVVTVLDTSFELPASALLRSAAKIRSRPPSWSHVLAPDTLAVQERLQAMRNDRFPDAVPSSLWPGLLLSAAAPDQAALELKGDRYTSGVFTTCLTRQLWQAVPASTIYIDVQRLQNRTTPIVWQAQTPYSESNLGNTINLQELGLIPTLSQGLEGVITTINFDRQEVELWLGGLSNPILRSYGTNAALRVARSGGSEPEIVLQILQRDQFVAKARVISGGTHSPQQLFVGQGIQEKIRLIPQSNTLVVALDNNLDRIERVDATSAFAGLHQVKVLTQTDQSADYVFRRLGKIDRIANDWNPYRVSYSSSRYGLVAPGQDILPGTASLNDEAVKTAVQRLDARFQSLLAMKIFGLLENSVTTHLPLALQVEDNLTGAIVVDYRAERALNPVENSIPSSIPSNSIPLLSLPIGHSLTYRIYNLSDRVFYGLLLMYEPNGSFSVGYPSSLIPGYLQPLGDWSLPPNNSAYPESRLEGVLPGLIPEISLFLFISRRPLTRTLKAITPNLGSGISVLKPLNNPLTIAQAIVQDLQEASSETWSESGRSDAWALDMSAWAALRLTCKIQY